jgi:hypothetical protein
MGRSLVAYNVRFNKKAASEALTESLVSFLEPPVPPPATLRGDPFLELPMKLQRRQPFAIALLLHFALVKRERGGAISDKRWQDFDASSPEHAAPYIRWP